MKVTQVFLALPAADHASAVAWYVRLAGSASVYVVADPVRAGRAMLTIAVVDTLLADLRERGIAATIVMDAGMRAAFVADPDGNRIKFFEDPPVRSSVAAVRRS